MHDTTMKTMKIYTGVT